MPDFFQSAFVTLLVTLDPPGLAPIFIALTLGMTKDEKHEVAIRASIIAFTILLVFALGGTAVMAALGISLPAFRIAGGLLLFYTAFQMIFAERGQRKKELAADAVTIDHIDNLAAFPLAIPLMSGPGSITAVILLAERAGGNWKEQAGLILVVAIIVLLCYIVFRLSERVSRLFGTTGTLVLGRMLGVVLAALAAQFVIDGIRAVNG
ncbi:MarC family protein [uncultured Methylovirgula sp.]|uniref:MarC family protein n=1 Tax=uncultured Methylovirgula sp. TaxID=1285960 RepID=UPI00263151EE|nr:MarC family protein [uncultured Methylovirgula sp.]